MNFQLIGINHHTAPVEVRERLAVPESRLPEALQRLVQYPGVEECLILSTCNRVRCWQKQPTAVLTCADFYAATSIWRPPN